MPKKKEDNSIEVFYEELLNKILEDPCENSYTEFNYEFKQRNKLFDSIQNYIENNQKEAYSILKQISKDYVYNV